MRNNRKVPFGEALDKLEKAAKRTPKNPVLLSAIPPSKIKLAPDVFQPRTIAGAMGEDEGHVRELQRGLKAKGKGGVLEAILVIRIGNKTYCVDGHHRLAAYRKERTPYAVPVEWFTGAIREAVFETAKRNSRDRLPMRRREKLEAAWRMTALGGHSKSKIAEATTVAVSTIATMRKTLKLITADQKDYEPYDAGPFDFSHPGPEPRDMTWEEARSYGKKDVEHNEEWQEKIAMKWAEQLAQAFGKKWGKMPEIAARAIDLYSEGLSRDLIEYWVDDAREVVAAMDDDEM